MHPADHRRHACLLLILSACAPSIADGDKPHAHRGPMLDTETPGQPQTMGGGTPQSITIDNQTTSSRYGVLPSERWWSSTSTPGYLGDNYLVAQVGQHHDPVVFWFEQSSPQCRRVEARWTAGSNRTQTATWVATGPNGTDLGHAVVDQRSNGGTWNVLGQWHFPAGVNEVSLTRWGSDGGFAIADAIRLTPCGVGSVEDDPDPSASRNSSSLNVPYFYQYDNTYEPAATCGITSAAMAINHWFPGRVSPDSLYLRYGKAQGQSPSGIQGIYQSEGLYSRSTTTGTRADIQHHLDAGRPVVVHGFWTASGHIATIVGYDASAWIVNDPAGDWEVCYGCGPADHVRYAFGGGWDQAMSWDGDIWFSISDTSPM